MDRGADAYSVVRSGSSSPCSCVGVMSAWRPDFTGTVAVCAAWWGQAVWLGMFLCSWLEVTIPTLVFAAVQQKNLNLMCLLLCHCSGAKVKITLNLKQWFVKPILLCPAKRSLSVTVSSRGLLSYKLQAFQIAALDEIKVVVCVLCVHSCHPTRPNLAISSNRKPEGALIFKSLKELKDTWILKGSGLKCVLLFS